MDEIKIQRYKAALDCVVYIRHFMYSENHYFRVLDEALQPFVDAVQFSINDVSLKSSSDD